MDPGSASHHAAQAARCEASGERTTRGDATSRACPGRDAALLRCFAEPGPTTHTRPIAANLRPFRFLRFGFAGDLFMAGRPQRVLLGAVLIRVAVGRDIFPRGALAFFERIGICTHDLAFLMPRDFAFKGGLNPVSLSNVSSSKPINFCATGSAQPSWNISKQTDS